MTSFIAYYNLCQISEPNDFLGVSSDKESDDVIVTVSRNTVVVIKISTQKPMRSWSIVERLSTKVIFDQRSNKYVGLFGDKVLRCWDPSTSDVNRIKKIKFHKNIVGLISSKEDTLLLYSDGCCELLEVAINTRKVNLFKTPTQNLSFPFDFEKSALEDITLKVLSNGRKYVAYFEKCCSSGDMELVYMSLEHSGNFQKRFKIKRDDSNVHLVGYTVTEGDNCLMLLTIWSDKRVFMLNLHDSIEPEKLPGNFVSMISTIRTDCPLSVTNVAKHYVAIYGANNGQEGASLLLYNTQFKVVKAKQFFKVYFNVSRLWVANENIFLTMGQNLTVVTYRMSKEVLAELLGTQNSFVLQTKIASDYISEEEYANIFIKWKDVKAKNNNIDKNVLNLSSSSNILKRSIVGNAYQEFHLQINLAKQFHTHVDIKKDKQPVECVMYHPSNKTNATFCENLQNIFRQLECGGESENEIAEKLLAILVNTNLQAITECLLRLSTISDLIFVQIVNKLLVHTFQCSEVIDIKSEQLDVRNEDKLTDKFEISKHYQKALNYLLKCTCMADLILKHAFNILHLPPYVHQIVDYSKVLVMLEYLYKMLSEENYFIKSNKNVYHIQFEMQVIRFFNIFINAHFQHLSLSKDIQLMSLFSKWSKLLYSMYKFQNEELNKLATILKNIIQRKKTFKEKNSLKWYYIEELDLF